MKILIVITGADIGGAQRHVMQQVSWFQANGNVVEVVTGEEGPLVDWLTARKIAVRVIPIPRTIQAAADWKAFLTLRKHIKQNHYDIVHCHSSKAGIIGRLAAFVNRTKKIVFTAHGFVFTDPTLSKKKKAFYLFLERLFGMFSTDIITVSHYDYRAGIHIGLNPKKLHVIHNGIQREDILSEAEWTAKQSKLRNSEKQVIGFVGRFASEKNIDMIIRLAERVKNTAEQGAGEKKAFDEKRTVEFWLVGDGKLEEDYRRMVLEKGLEKIVRFLGNQKDVLGLMDQMHLLLITSHKEGLPYVLLEAMGRGLPVLSTDVGGIKEVLDPNGELGVLVGLNDDQEMYGKIERLLHHPVEREELGKRLLIHASSCTAELMCEKTKGIYQS
jgi:glycosyltransferase involved in cell wall biosynthesis